MQLLYGYAPQSDQVSCHIDANRAASTDALRAVDRVALVRPENARAVEEHLIKLARSGKLGGGKVDEGSIVKLLEDVGAYRWGAHSTAQHSFGVVCPHTSHHTCLLPTTLQASLPRNVQVQ